MIVLDVIAKKKREILYCETVAHWSKENVYKPWKYLFIPANQIYPNSTFITIAKKFVVTEEELEKEEQYGTETGRSNQSVY